MNGSPRTRNPNNHGNGDYSLATPCDTCLLDDWPTTPQDEQLVA